MLSSLRKNGLTSLFKEVRPFFLRYESVRPVQGSETAESGKELQTRAPGRGVENIGCVIAQAFFSRGVSAISLKSRVSSGGA